MKKIVISLTALSLLAGMSSCKKDSSSNTQTPPAANTPPTVTPPSGAYAAFAVVRVQTAFTTPSYPGVPSQTVDYNIGTAAGGVHDAVGSTTYVDAGTVKVNDSTLTKASNNGYVFSPTGAASGSDLGLKLNEFTHNWSATGNGSAAAFTYAHTGYLPTVGTITSSADVQTNAAYTLTVNSISSNGDSVIWIIAGPNGHAQHVTVPGTYSTTFTAAEVGALGKGDNMGIVQVAPYFVTPATINGKQFYFIKESCATKMINLK